MDAEPKVLDIDEALTHVDGDREILFQLWEMYLEQSASDMVEIESAVNRKDAERLQFVAHSLKGSSANVAAERVRAIAYKLEEVGASGTLTDAMALLQQLKESMKITTETIRKQIDTYRSGKGDKA